MPMAEMHQNPTKRNKKINVRENQRANQKWQIQRLRHRTDKQNK
jgi:hypothetical protein